MKTQNNNNKKPLIKIKDEDFYLIDIIKYFYEEKQKRNKIKEGGLKE